MEGKEKEERGGVRLQKKMWEGAEEGVDLGEDGRATLQGVLDHRDAELRLHAALFRDVFDHLGDEVEGFLLEGLRAVGLRLGLALARAALALRRILGVAFEEQAVVVDEFVAVGGQQIGGRVLQATARSEESRGGQAWVSTGSYGWSQFR